MTVPKYHVQEAPSGTGKGRTGQAGGWTDGIHVDGCSGWMVQRLPFRRNAPRPSTNGAKSAAALEP